MENILFKLKSLLNSLSDEELKNYYLLVDSKYQVDIISIDENAITLITDSKKLVIDYEEW